jgi:hypothetical protein
VKNTGQAFNIVYKGNTIKVEVHSAGKQEILKVCLPDILFITKSKDFDQYDFWTSVPQGRQQLAEEIGELIDNLNDKRKTDNNSLQTSLF